MFDTLTIALAGHLAAACTPDQGMGCFPCCGVTSSTTGLQQSGDAGLGAAVAILVVWALVALVRR